MESEFLNTLRPKKCPYCGNESYVGYGRLCTGLRRYICKDCGRTFTILTGTLLENHKQPISEWIDTCLGLFTERSFEAISKANRKAYNTPRYWIGKIFLALRGTQDGIMLSGNVYLDETYLKVSKGDVERRSDGKEYRGVSRNQICIGIAYDGSHVYCCILGHGKPSQKAVYNGFKDHIVPDSTLIHDKEKAHKKLVQELGLESIEYDSKQQKGLPDRENPLEPINRRCYELQRLMRRHPGFSRDDLHGYLDLFSYIHNPPQDKYEYTIDDARQNGEYEYHNLKARNTLTLGLGYRGKFMYADVAYKYDFYKSDFYMFDDYRFSNDGNSIVSRNSAAAVNHDRHQLLLTLGVKF